MYDGSYDSSKIGTYVRHLYQERAFGRVETVDLSRGMIVVLWLTGPLVSKLTSHFCVNSPTISDATHEEVVLKMLTAGDH